MRSVSDMVLIWGKNPRALEPSYVLSPARSTESPRGGRRMEGINQRSQPSLEKKFARTERARHEVNTYDRVFHPDDFLR